jgi:hypothetical protein
MHPKAPPIHVLPEGYRNSMHQLTDFSPTPPSTPSLTSLSSLSSSNSSVCSISYRSRRSGRSKPQSKESSRLSSTPQTYDDLDEQFVPIGFKKIEESFSGSRSRGQSYDSTTDCSSSPELGVSDSGSLWSQSISEPSVISYQPSLASSIDENCSNSNIQIENLKGLPRQNLPSNSSNAMTFQGKFSCEDVLALF